MSDHDEHPEDSKPIRMAKAAARNLQKQEGVEAVVVMITFKDPDPDAEPGDSRCFKTGAGNWCAQYGLARSWVDGQKIGW